MKIRSLLLGSVAAAGLSTGAYAADLGVLTAVNVCDELGLSGLVIASDTNCLQISGEVKYEFRWGDYVTGDDFTDISVITTEHGTYNIPAADGDLDWRSRVDAWIKFVATANSDFGPAKAVIKIKEIQYINGTAGGFGTVVFGGSDTANGEGLTSSTDNPDKYYFDEAYVSIGDTTVIMAGKKGTIMNLGDDVPLNYLGLFNSEDVDLGVKWNNDLFPDGGHVIQVTTDLGNGVSAAAGLEAINNLNTTLAGTLVGVLAYAGDGISAHVTGVAGGVLDGTIEYWGVHAGVSGTFDPIKFAAAIAANNSDPGSVTGIYWNALATASATFDMFTIAVAGEAAADTDATITGNTTTGQTDFGAGASVSVAATDTVTINLGGRWYVDASDETEGGVAEAAWQAEAQLVAAVTETLTLTAALGTVTSTDVAGVFYGSAEVAWVPGGGFTSSLKGEAYSNGAFRTIFKAAKTFE